MAGEMSKGDPWGYLKGTGLPKAGVPKSRPEPKMSTPMPNERKLTVTCSTMKVARDPEFKQPDPPMTAKRTDAMGAYRNMDDSHSGKYEKLEKKVIKGAGLKGSVEKVLSEGHNTRGESMKHEKKESKAHERGESKAFEAKENRGNPGNGAVSKKISHLVKGEGKPQKQAVAMALNMKREGRLTKEGGYKRVGKKKGK